MISILEHNHCEIAVDQRCLTITAQRGIGDFTFSCQAGGPVKLDFKLKALEGFIVNDERIEGAAESTVREIACEAGNTYVVRFVDFYR